MSLTGGTADEPKTTKRRFDPYKLSSPQIFLISMVIFLALAVIVGAALYRQISTAFFTNPGLNGLIFGVMLAGIVLAFVQVFRLIREVRWVNSFRSGDSTQTREPILLAPMKVLLSRSNATALTPITLRSILDSIATRLDESRDILRYLIGLLVFLGLLGTFWGLLRTIGSIGDTIQSLDPGTGDTNAVLDSLKAGLAAPLSGMGTAFSSSLFGLSGSLVIGFLDLQAGRAQNRFYLELENWLSSVTDLSSEPGAPIQDGTSTDAIRALSERLRTLSLTGGGNEKSTQAMASLAEGIAGLVKNMRSEQQMIRDWVEAQARDQKASREILEQIALSLSRRDGNG
jgi:hypothetical protein